VYAQGPSGGVVDISSAAAFGFDNLTPGDYTLLLWNSQNHTLTNGPTVAVVAAATTNTDIDISSTFARVTGIATVSGSPVGNAYIDVNYDVTCTVANPDGSFTFMLPPGSYGAAIRPAGYQDATGVFYFSAETVGQTSNLGTIAAQAPTTNEATLQGTVRFNGSPFSLIDPSCPSWVAHVQINGGNDAALSPTGTYSRQFGSGYNANINVSVTPGTNGGEAGRRLGERQAYVVRSVSTTADIDLTATAGVATGQVTVNGSPLTDGYIYIYDNNSGYPCTGINSSGQFNILLAPGSYTASVYTSASALLGTFPFSIAAGQTTNVDSGTTPTGTNVTVVAGGGLGTPGGSQITFSSVTQSGQTTIAQSGVGPPPPTAFSILTSAGQPRYWDIDTTASFSGAVAVCFHYDDSELVGPENELALQHYDGVSFTDITSSIDTQTNVICGISSSLSPFAVTELLPGDSDGDTLDNRSEFYCGSPPGDGSKRPERIDGPFAGVDDDGDDPGDGSGIDEPLPPGAAPFDCDGDGWKGNEENLIYGDAPSTASDQDPCGSSGWASDLAGNNNIVNIQDLNSFLSPNRLVDDGHGLHNKMFHALDEDGDTVIDPAMARWNLQTPPHTAATLINIGDLNAIITGADGSPARPPMFGGQQAFFTNGGMCPWAP